MMDVKRDTVTFVLPVKIKQELLFLLFKSLENLCSLSASYSEQPNTIICQSKKAFGDFCICVFVFVLYTTLRFMYFCAHQSVVVVAFICHIEFTIRV